MEPLTVQNIIKRPKLTQEDFKRVSRLVYSECGIKLTKNKKCLLESRLQKRLLKLGIDSFGLYCDYLFSPKGFEDELPFLIESITTNQTGFFREPGHYDFLQQTVLPNLLKKHSSSLRKEIRAWSAGCSTGEEPFSIAMSMDLFAEHHPDFCYSLLASDISSAVLEKAQLGIYDDEEIESIPIHIKRKFFLRSKDREKNKVRIKPQIRTRITFEHMNLMNIDLPGKETMDIIFCRNVMIYFDRLTQHRLLYQFDQHLKPGGYIFLGHSETLNGMNLPWEKEAPTIYRKNDVTKNG